MEKKLCTAPNGCREFKELSEFSWRDKFKGTKSNLCKKCDSAQRLSKYETRQIKEVPEECKISLEWLARPIVKIYYTPLHQ